MGIDRRTLLASVAALTARPAQAIAEAPTVAELEQAARTLAFEREAAARIGLPLSDADLRLPECFVEETAAPLYRELRALRENLVDSGVPERASLLTRNPEALSPTDRRQRAALMTEWEPAVALAERAAALPHCGNEAHWENVPELDFAPGAGMRIASQLLRARAEVAQDTGEGDSLRWLELAGRIAHHAAEEPSVVAYAQASAFHSYACGTLRGLAIRACDDAAFIKRAQVVAERIALELDPARALHGDLLFGLAGARDPAKGLGPSEFEFRSPEEIQRDQALLRLPHRLVGEALEARLLSVYRRGAEALRHFNERPWEALAAARALVASEEARADEASRTISSRVAHVCESACTFGLRARTASLLTQAFLSVLKERAPDGAFPPKLPEPVTDPHDGKLLRYRRERAGFVLYSAGLNQRDDGGNAATLDGTGVPADVVLSFPMKPEELASFRPTPIDE